MTILPLVCAAWRFAGACGAGDAPAPEERRAREERDAAAEALDRTWRTTKDGGEPSVATASPAAEITAYEWHESERYGYRFLRPTSGWTPAAGGAEPPGEPPLEEAVYSGKDGSSDEDSSSLTVSMTEQEPGPLWSGLRGTREHLDAEFGELAARADREASPCRAAGDAELPAILECFYEYAAEGGEARRVRQVVLFQGNRRYDFALEAGPEALERHEDTFEEVVSSLRGPESVRYESEEAGSGFDYPADWVVGRPNLLVPGAGDRGAGEPGAESLALLPPDESAVSFFELYGPFEDRGAADFEEFSRGVFDDAIRGLDGEVTSPCEMIEQRPTAYAVECAGRLHGRSRTAGAAASRVRNGRGPVLHHASRERARDPGRLRARARRGALLAPELPIVSTREVRPRTASAPRRHDERRSLAVGAEGFEPSL